MIVEEKEKSKLPKKLKLSKDMSFDECQKEILKLKNQFCTIHNLPKVDGKTSLEYMHETLEAMRNRCIELHWRSIEILKSTHQRKHNETNG
jgi:hypothetical protein